ncbi:Protein-S-isoprenylcysteine O-methyltransferase [Smittium culicis]|uniref:Protein-S-isoprenylcysteine O-methyltransferase n=1 Tax=Smittium culicis TaxID=133412 RepID=A0A1R1YMJ9_9FUNG|nr:Protein-S-isoprenylcysteine O-methyltransferase [Smittium culicis]
MATAKTSFNHIIAHQKLDSHTLVTNGVFNIDRHPSYIGFFFWATGLQIMLMNPLSFIVFVYVLMNFFIRRARYEENTLNIFFGNEYKKYKEKVPTLIPIL